MSRSPAMDEDWQGNPAVPTHCEDNSGATQPAAATPTSQRPPPPKMLRDIWDWASENCEAAGAQGSSQGLGGHSAAEAYEAHIAPNYVWQYVSRHVSEYVQACKEAQWQEEPVPHFYKDLTDGREFPWILFMQKYAPETFDHQRLRRFGICWLPARRRPGFHIVLDTYELISPTEDADKMPWFKSREKQEEVFEG